MTTFDKREHGFENKFAHDQELEFRAISRGNKLAARWAAELMGLEGEHVEDYIRAVVRSEVEQAGAEDVFRKITLDLKAAGTHVTETEVRSRMEELLAQAREQIRAGA
jgi:hypothetical protein